jgi:putative transposase
MNSGSTLDRNDMNYMLTELKEEKPWLNNYHSKMLQMISTKIAGATKALESSKARGYESGKGKLHFIKKGECKTFVYNQSGFKIERHGNADLLWLSKIGYIEIRLSRAVFNIKQVTITKCSNKWYACVVYEQPWPLQKPIVNLKKHVGIDVGVIKFAHDSDNYEVSNPQFLRKMLKPLRRANRRFSRKQKGSKNREKAKTRLQLLHGRIKNKRKDFLHKISTKYARRYNVIFLERLKILNMVKNRSLARSILDSGWTTFKEYLRYKAKMMIEVAPINSSVECSRCHKMIAKALAVRMHCCDYCGLEIDRDYNASKNIQFRGLQQLERADLLPQELREFTPVEIGVPCSNACSQSVKQEETLAAMQVSSRVEFTKVISSNMLQPKLWQTRPNDQRKGRS